MNLLLISNSTNAGEPYLDYPKHNIKEFLASKGVKKALFIPYAAVTFSYDEYLEKVRTRFTEIGFEVESIHSFDNKKEAIMSAEAIVVGGGNTFHLVKSMQDDDIMDAIKERVEAGVPYIGWSAGSNVACPRLCTTNDMPIVEPRSFNTLDIIPFQINPHYMDAHVEGHAGETREQRIMEFIAANKGVKIAGLREGCMLLIENKTMKLIGERTLRLFGEGEPIEYSSSDDLTPLLKR